MTASIPTKIAFKYPGSEDCYIFEMDKNSIFYVDLAEAWTLKNAFVFADFEFYKTGKVIAFVPQHIRKFKPDDQFSIGLATSLNSHQSIENQTSKEEFIDNVNLAKKKISQGVMEKVTMSRIKHIPLKSPIQADKVFMDLCHHFPGAFVYYVSSPDYGSWACATPECLFSCRDKKVKSMSLAGTMSSNQPISWGEKETVEQQIVTDYISGIFKKAGFSDVQVNGPETYKIGNLKHLKTDFITDFDGENKDALTQFIRLLHPTPAVGGFPKDASIDFIQSTEKHNRSFYTGFSGLINFEQGSDLFVNLRFFQVFENRLTFYAGAGITNSSDAEKEWEETENKIKMTADLFVNYF